MRDRMADDSKMSHFPKRGKQKENILPRACLLMWAA
jgi:hypothetical protein